MNGQGNSPIRPIRTVVKIGGSLFDWPKLADGLRQWLRPFAPGEVLLVPGGGDLAEAIRKLDRLHGLGDTTAHWLALRTLTVSAHFLQSLLPSAVIVAQPSDRENEQASDRWAILDGFAFALADVGRPGELPRSWEVSSDSLALRAALVFSAERLLLIKSAEPPLPYDVEHWARCGYVDAYFPKLARATAIAIEAINGTAS